MQRTEQETKKQRRYKRKNKEFEIKGDILMGKKRGWKMMKIVKESEGRI